MPGDDYIGAAKSIKLEEFQNVHKMPCARQAFMTGIVAGFAMGGLQFTLRARPWRASNWAIMSFIGVSALVWETCRFRRYREHSNVKYAVERVEQKRREKQPGEHDKSRS